MPPTIISWWLADVYVCVCANSDVVPRRLMRVLYPSSPDGCPNIPKSTPVYLYPEQSDVFFRPERGGKRVAIVCTVSVLGRRFAKLAPARSCLWLSQSLRSDGRLAKRKMNVGIKSKGKAVGSRWDARKEWQGLAFGGSVGDDLSPRSQPLPRRKHWRRAQRRGRYINLGVVQTAPSCLGRSEFIG